MPQGRLIIRAFALVLGVAAIAGAGAALQAAAQQAQHHTVIAGDAIKWGPAPPSLPSGAQAAALYGSPAQDGTFVLRLKLPAGFVIPPHRHSKDEMVTVISGQVAITPGETVDRAVKMQPAGSLFHLPAGMSHYLVAESETVVQINGVGPFDVTYINPKDDPRKKD